MKYKDLSNKEFIALITRETDNQMAWAEFTRRFHAHICDVIFFEMKSKGLAQQAEDAEDLAQEVYRRIIKNQCHILKGFKGEHENSIFSFLATIAISVVFSKIRERSAQKRPPDQDKVSLDKPAGHKKIDLKEVIPEDGGIADLTPDEIVEEIEYCAKKVAATRRFTQLYLMIFNLYFFEDLRATEIAQKPQVDRGWKRVENIVSEMKHGVRECLSHRLKM